jgi:hypothetical protein
MSAGSQRLCRRTIAACVAVAFLTAIVGCSGSLVPAPSGSPVTPPASDLVKPSVPASGSYLGAWVNPNPATKPSKASVKAGTVSQGQQEIDQLPAFEQQTGARVGILHVYAEFANPFPTATLNAIEAAGATPMLDWSCGNVGDINDGKDDAIITAYANDVRTFGKPLFLRWYWEMNLDDQSHRRCGDGSSDPSAFIKAWDHIHTIFDTQHATNAAFVWAPSGLPSKTPDTDFYPGDNEVDWIGIDHYDDHGDPAIGTASVAALFDTWYRQWSGHGKPMMIAETGAPPADQAGYLQGLEQALPSRYQDIHALVYFDSPGTKGPFTLTGPGVTAFSTLAKDPYFTAK